MSLASEAPDPGSSSSDPYARLGVAADAPFDEVQAARAARLEELSNDDPLARSRIEAAYDAVLMDRLKERQQGRVSTAARTASQREQVTPQAERPALPTLPRLPALPLGRTASAPSLGMPRLALAEAREFWVPVLGIAPLLVLLLLPGVDPGLPLSLGVLVALVNLQRRSGRFLQAVLTSLGLLVVGLLLGAGVLALLGDRVTLLPLASLQLQSLPALLLLLLGALLIA
ncbi:MAG: CPP1-like family protein [Cyanobacteriota bacterium]|nr:CPP1-like family protein [Cyanobacteriota bacterium]